MKSRSLRPDVEVTYEPEPDSRTSVERRPIPLATCWTPNWASLERLILDGDWSDFFNSSDLKSLCVDELSDGIE